MASVSVAPPHARALLVLVVTLTAALMAAAPPPARAAWVESDYPSSVPCGVTIPVEQCDPAADAANAACRDMCHYGGRRGGRCVSPGRLALVQGCHCRC
ncbi:hypothetical protein SEVIR_9G191000v4 [Setaria viridis]|uniref:Knottin scorpion toxin-like domain-containing protein n=2 Tax=Setaria TaxID=4554 RepID=K4AH45_SETIT|nr:uncharacterized protein LOC101760392 [Setaria italica]XP_034571929.1 uncharacterized protein LOC117836580 [Setaria viridis]RCV42136.1 hypothetical protein SETIT_9G191700v2 [Setaria italica]TKV92890.1 hypothetical protein SEVIR_9G191000v2 [Setaria viridis]